MRIVGAVTEAGAIECILNFCDRQDDDSASC